jgi:hypothetical protein
MKRFFTFIGIAVFVVIIVAMVLYWFFARKPVPPVITYGMSFNTVYARELGLDWKQTYDAILYELGVRHLRLAAHWPMIEPLRDVYNFEEIDYQVAEAERAGATVILAVGRRLPRWPECHIPTWAREEAWEVQKKEILTYMEAVITRYKDSPAVTVWQVENEPYLAMFAFEHCGALDEAFLAQQVALVHSLDATRPILVTDSGNLGTWTGAYQRGDMFGTSVYVYFWNPELGQFSTLLPPSFYRVKESVMRLLYGSKPTLLIELSAEPWLVEPVVNVDLNTQFSRMNPEKFQTILDYARETRYESQYLWGAEWWYWLKEKGEPGMWEMGQTLFPQANNPTTTSAEINSPQ